jgi:type I restriction enzyme S subunit
MGELLRTMNLNQYSASAAQPGLSVDTISALKIPVPPFAEQCTIAAFLDTQTIRLGTLIAKKQALIEKLKEKRTALIFQTVTRGLPPDAARAAGLDPYPNLKPSRIEWFGEVPEHWEVLSLARVTISRCDGPFGSNLKSEHYSDQGVRVVRLQNIRFGAFDASDEAFIDEDYCAQLGDHDVQPGDLLIAGLGDDNHSVGRACVAPSTIGPVIVKADCFRFRLNRERVDPLFIALQLSSTARALAGAFSTGTTRSRMNLSMTSQRAIAVPPVPEQRAIANFLDREAAKIDRMVAKVEAAIERLQEYRTALITAAVTGKIDVRPPALGDRASTAADARAELPA